MLNITHIQKIVFSTFVSSFALNASLAAAAPENTKPNVLEEIVVSAQKRGDQSLQSVATGIRAFTSGSMDKFNIRSFEDYAKFTPGLNFSKRGPGQNQVIMRGLSIGRVSTSQPQNRSLVGIYLDDVPLTLNGYNPDIDTFDIERIEIAKGPQGTLYGDSAMAGTIRYITKSPDLQNVEGRVNLTGSSTRYGGEGFSVNGVVNLPVIQDKLGIRVMAFYKDEPGWIDNIGRNEKNVNQDKTRGVRMTGLLQANDNLSFKATLLWQKTKTEGSAEEEDTQGVGNLLQDRPADESFRDNGYLATLTTNYDFEWGTLTSVTGYLDRNFDSVRQARGIELFAASLGASFQGSLIDPWTQKTFDQELRLSFGKGNRLEGVIGGIYLNSEVIYPTYASGEGFDQFLIDFVGFPDQAAVDSLGCSPEFPDHFFCGSMNTKQKQYAAFGEMELHVTDEFSVTAGARYFDWTQDFDERYAGFFNGGPTVKVFTTKDSGVNPKFSAKYNVTPDVMVYTSAAKGYRLGGVNDPLPNFCDAELNQRGLSNVEDYGPDSLWNYEGGFKTTFADKRIRLNGSVFYVDWKDIQVPFLLDSCLYVVTINSAAARSKGFELETDIVVTNGLNVNLGLSYTDAYLAEASPELGAAKGATLPFSSKWKFAMLGTYDFLLTSTLDGFVNVGFQYQSKSDSAFQAPVIEIPSQTVANLSFGVRTDRYMVKIFANNIWDERAVIDAASSGGIDTRVYTRPRTLGLELDASF